MRSQHDKQSPDLMLPARRALPERVAERLIAGIADGTIRPGERLVETTLAASLGVSRAPLREAFRQLEAQGLVETRNGRGTWVREVSDEHVHQMLSVRALLEGLAARLVAVHGSEDDHGELAAIHDRFETAVRSGNTEVWRRIDWEFHEAVCRLSGNSVLLAAWRSVSILVRVFLHKHQGFEADVARIVANHREFLDAITSRDPSRAEDLFRSRILETGYRQLGRAMPEGLTAYVTVAVEASAKPETAIAKPAISKRRPGSRRKSRH